MGLGSFFLIGNKILLILLCFSLLTFCVLSLLKPIQQNLGKVIKEGQKESMTSILTYLRLLEKLHFLEELKENIINQVTNKVRWKETMEYALDKKINKVLECGSGKVLSGLFKRFSKDFNVYNIETIEDLKKFEI